MLGGAPAVTYSSSPRASDVITDFTAADTVSFAKSLFANLAAIKRHASLNGSNDVIITVNATNKVTLDNVHKLTDLHAGDFIFV